jgi:hypothetical protein
MYYSYNRKLIFLKELINLCPWALTKTTKFDPEAATFLQAF